LKENASLLFLDLSSNRIGEEGTKAIAEGLKENQTLRSLQLNGNPIGDHGVMIIIESVGVYCSVRDLGLQDCSTSKTGAGIFDPLNPTGQYSLDLAKEFDRELLKRCA
jgi:Ran GTPase-activating protein (RanGAP) involved in mRNA processing and transport